MPKANDLTLYDRAAEQWWDLESPAFRSLHSVNAFRLELLREWIGAQHADQRVVDLGCGGGLMTQLFVDGGARVVGLDLSHPSLRVARDRLDACFVRADALRTPISTGCADFVLMAEMLEHLEDPARALSEAARILRPGGACFVSTLNRTLRARILAVWLAEGLGLVPRGTHAARLFVAPRDLERWSASSGLKVERLQGEALDCWKTLRRWTVVLRRGREHAVTYSALLRKPTVGACSGLLRQYEPDRDSTLAGLTHSAPAS